MGYSEPSRPPFATPQPAAALASPPWTGVVPGPPGAPGAAGPPGPAGPPAETRVWSRKRSAALFTALMVASVLYSVLIAQGAATFNSSISVPVGAEVGQCFAAGSKQAVACDGRHTFEVFGSAQHPADAEYPSAVERAMRNTVCNQQFESHTGQNLYLSDYDYQQIFPSEHAWMAGEKTVICALHRDNLRPIGNRFGGWFSP